MNNYVIPTTCYHKIANILGLVFLIGPFVYIILSWNSFPEELPMHYNAAGEIDRWGGKQELIVFQIIPIIIYISISILEKFPLAWNTGVKITEQNRDVVYVELKNMIISTKLTIVATFAFLLMHIALALPLPWWFLPVDLICLFGFMFFFITRIYKKGKSKVD